MKFKEHDKVTVKISQAASVTGEIVHVGELSRHYYVSAGQHSGYYEEHELEPLYPLQKGVTYFNVAPNASHLPNGTEMLTDQVSLHMAQYKTFDEDVEEWAKSENIDAKDLPASPTGSLRFNTGKPQTNEISPEFILDMGRVLAKSREKYPRANWSLGNNYSVPYDSLIRHLLAWQGGEKNDIESGYSHLAHAALNLMMLHYYEERFPELDDRIFKKEKK